MQIIVDKLQKGPKKLPTNITNNLDIICFKELKKNRTLDQLIEKVKKFWGLAESGKIWEKFSFARFIKSVTFEGYELEKVESLEDIEKLTKAKIDTLYGFLEDIFNSNVELDCVKYDEGIAIRITEKNQEKNIEVEFYDNTVVVSSFQIGSENVNGLGDLYSVAFKL